jgi:hypothetical protein
VVDFCYGEAVGGEIERGEIRGVHRLVELRLTELT